MVLPRQFNLGTNALATQLQALRQNRLWFGDRAWIHARRAVESGTIV